MLVITMVFGHVDHQTQKDAEGKKKTSLHIVTFLLQKYEEMSEWPKNQSDICLTLLFLGLFATFVDETADGQKDDEQCDYIGPDVGDARGDGDIERMGNEAIA